MRWMGAAFILISCGGFGFSIAYNYRQRERLLQQLFNALEMMLWLLYLHLQE